MRTALLLAALYAPLQIPIPSVWNLVRCLLVTLVAVWALGARLWPLLDRPLRGVVEGLGLCAAEVALGAGLFILGYGGFTIPEAHAPTGLAVAEAALVALAEETARATTILVTLEHTASRALATLLSAALFLSYHRSSLVDPVVVALLLFGGGLLQDAIDASESGDVTTSLDGPFAR